MRKAAATQVGTEITLFLTEDCLEFANEYRMQAKFIDKILFLHAGKRSTCTNAEAEPQYETIDEADLREDDVIVERIHEDGQDGREGKRERREGSRCEVSPAKDRREDQQAPGFLE